LRSGVGIASLWIALMGASALAEAQSSPALSTPARLPSGSSPDSTVTGGRIHGVVKSGNIPLPGVAVTAQNTLTGKRFTTTTDMTGAWSMTILQTGRYVVRTQFAAFAPGSLEALLNASNHDQAVNFDLVLASRAVQQEQQQDGQAAQVQQVVRQLAGNGLQSLSLMSVLGGGDTDATGVSSGGAGATLPSIAGNSEFTGDSVSITGQSGSVSPLAGVDMDRMRDFIESMRAQNGGQGPGGPGQPQGAGGNFAGGGGLFGGGVGGGDGFGFGGGGFGGGRGGGGRGNFRNFNPSQPHGSIFWTGSNSALNAEPFSLRGQPQEQPASGTNRFGVTLMGAPFIPGLFKPSGKDTVFLTVSGTRNSSPLDEYATVPTDAERAGVIPGLANPITPVPEAAALLQYIPEPNLPGDVQNYHLLTTAQSNTTQAGIRYMRGIGANASPFGGRGGGGGGRRSQQTTQGLRQSVNFNYNWAHTATDNVNVFPELGGKTASDSNSLQAGYTLGHRKLTSIFNANWNRSDSHAINFFTKTTDIATQIGILGPDGNQLNPSPLNYGLPNVTLSSFTGLNQQQPKFAIAQTLTLSETLAWIHGKHNLRFGGDYRRVHNDFLGGSNATGSFYFTGFYTGSSLGDFLLGLPQETSIDSADSKSYLRDNVFELYAQDDWRIRSNLTLNYGVRYEFFAPYTEKYNHLSMITTNPADGFTSVSQVEAGNSGDLPDSLVHPFRVAFAPRLGVAWRLPKQTVLRGGYGMNYTTGSYATFASIMALQPPFANLQTNVAPDDCASSGSGCLSIADGFPAPHLVGNYALDPHYRLPYVHVWNVDIQKTLPWGVVMNAGYNGSKGSNLDVTIAPRATENSPLTNPDNVLFNYEQAAAFSNFNAGTLRVNKRLSNGVALGATYQYAHAIDDAGSEGGTSTVVAQNWQDILAEEGNSNFDVRHKISGNYLYELPFGKDKYWFTTGKSSHILEGFSISGTFTFATGTPLTPSYQATVNDVARGTAGTGRPDRVPGVSLTAGGGSLHHWFNTAAFTAPTPDTLGNAFGTASRNSIPGPGIVQNNMSLSKTIQLGETRSFEIRATANNVFNTVQYSGVATTLFTGVESAQHNPFGQVTSVAAMRSFQFAARFRF
jgi:TonB dependent receptor-like, beta-barrel/Carboxypeptidase regulatory-like domain